MFQKKQIKCYVKKLKNYYFEATIPYTIIGDSNSLTRIANKLIEVKATNGTDAMICAIKSIGLEVTEDVCEKIVPLTKEQYDIAKLNKRITQVVDKLDSMRVSHTERIKAIESMSKCIIGTSIASCIISLIALIACLAAI